MPRARKAATPIPPAADAPDHFFAAYLKGEDPPSFATMRGLYEEAQRLLADAPWERLSEDQLVLCDDPVSGERYYISVMGALGELRGLQAYVGNRGYLFFRKMQDQVESMTAGEFLATQNSLFVHWEKLSDLTKPDREMLAAIGHPKTRGLPAPDIRSLRHGYHPWYVTEQEARALTLCLRAFLYAGERLRETDPADPALWSRAKVYPLISVDESGIPQAMKPENPPDPKPELGPPPVLDQARIDLILARKLPPSGVFQIDHFYGTGKVGERNERPGCVCMILVIDGESGMIYSPQVLPPEAVLGDSLVETLLGAIESANMLPKEVHVRREEYRIPLLALADLLKIRVLIKDRLPNLDMAKDALLGMMGDPGTIAME